MGKPYLKELQSLESTYSQVIEMDISPLVRAVISATSLPLISVGSGGSLSAAYYIALLHQMFSKQIAKAVTPLEVIKNAPFATDSAFWFLSAGGRNTDINNAFRKVVLNEPRMLLVICAKKGSPLVRFANRYKYTNIFDFDLPTKKDGFLATNSLIAFSTLSARTYLKIFSDEKILPGNIWELLNHKGSTESYLTRLKEYFSNFWNREYFIVLYSSLTQPAALDLESKFTEAALGSILLSDYRNFAHGRHYWLAERGNNSAVIALITDQDKELAQKTINLFPKGIPVAELYFPGHDIRASLSALVTSLYIAAIAGENRGIDPGQPEVPSFGRNIYHLRGINDLKVNLNIDISSIAVQRKALVINYPGNSKVLENLQCAYKEFVGKLEQQLFPSVVFDYDGTLCGDENRYGEIDDEIANGLRNLLDSGITIGIGTGRGKSVRERLQKAIPADLWDRVVIGYYNGGDCGILSDNNIPDGTDIPCPDLSGLAKIFKNKIGKLNFCKITVRKYQITIESKPPMSLEGLWMIAGEIVQHHGTTGTRIVKSGHSIDVLAPGVSKKTVIQQVRNMTGISPDAPVLCIGDSGRWPGNDYELLFEPFSLSVDEVSADYNTCWNLAPVGYRGVQAALYYLKCMDIKKNGFFFKLNKKGRINK